MDALRRDGLTFDVRDGGPPDGRTVVLLHGFPQDSSAWDAVAPLLHRHGLRTLALDQRGCSPGARPRGRAAYRLRHLADDVVALLDAAGLERAHVVGHDWGAAVGWALAAWRPERVATLTALSVPHPAAMTRSAVRSGQVLRSAYIGLFQAPLLPERLLLAGEAAALRRALVRGGLPGPAADRYVARMREPGALTAALNWYRALPWSLRDPVGRVRVPTLTVWSSGGPYVGRAAAEGAGRFVDAPHRLVVLDDLPHWIPERAPGRVAGLVAEHVDAG